MELQTRTKPSDNASGTVNLYRFGEPNFSGKGTSPDIAVERRNPLIAECALTTELVKTGATGKVFSYPLEITTKNISPKPPKNQVAGVVISYDEASVRCELNISERVVTVQLPRTLFPENIRYGFPISLEMIEEGGFRKPKISPRQIEKSGAAAIAAEFDSILSAI